MSLENQDLTNVVRGIQHAIASTYSQVANQYIFLIDQFFEEQDDGTYIPLMVRIDIDDKHHMRVPLISMVAPQGLVMKRVQVDMSVKLEKAQVKDATSLADNSRAERSSFKVSIAPKTGNSARRDSRVTDVSMVFEAGDPPEGIMRIIEQYANNIQPLPSPDSDPTTDDEPGPDGSTRRPYRLTSLGIRKRKSGPGAPTPKPENKDEDREETGGQ